MSASHRGRAKGLVLGSVLHYKIFGNVTTAVRSLAELTMTPSAMLEGLGLGYHISYAMPHPNNFSLFETAEEYYLSAKKIRCGDTIMEGSKDRDRGTVGQCHRNPCCDTNCRLTKGSVCDVSTCCENCSYTPAGTLCRAAEQVCDLPEYCRGHNATCPPDSHLQDGTPCTEDAYCDHGNCTDRTVHCRELFGLGAQDACVTCYGMNTKASRFGHCRREETSLTFQACDQSDVMCGRLQCTGVLRLPRLQEHVSFHQSLINGTWCFGLDEHRATWTLDAAHVRAGTLCAAGKFCNDSVCNTNVSALGYDCYPKKCH
ncbi:Disintegrin and metalloproteinase domain-containing protein 21 [Plecturocebus cupreus]